MIRRFLTDLGDDSEEKSGITFGGFGYGLALSFGVLLLVIIVIYAYKICSRKPPSSAVTSNHPSRRNTDAADEGSATTTILHRGLDEDTLFTYPKFLYSQAKLHLGGGGRGGAASSGCSICLAEYKDADMLRLLPDCGHLFHLGCVDPWLRLQPTCPVCRNSPLIRTQQVVSD